MINSTINSTVKNTIKGMLVDDEILTQRLLLRVIDWGKFNIDICATASDGLEAYENFQKHAPDLIVTDIRMPKLNGIELIKKVKEQNPDVHFILISAYADFHYVQEAIKLGCVDYILKPIDEKELENTLHKIVKIVNERNDFETLREKTESREKKALLWEYIKYGYGLQKVKGVFPDHTFEKCRLLSVHIGSDTMHQYESLLDTIYNQKSYISNTMTGIFDRFGSNILLAYEEDIWAVLTSNIEGRDVIQCANEIIEFFKNDFGFRAKICLSGEGNSLEELPAMNENLLLLSKYSQYTNSGDVIISGAVNGENGFDEKTMRAFQKKFSAAIERRDVLAAISIIDQVLDISKRASPLSLGRVYEFCFDAVLQIKRQIMTGGAGSDDDIPPIPGFLDISFAELSALTPIERLQGFMIDAVNALQNAGSEKKPVNLNRYVEQVIRILNEDYAKDISLDEICEKISISKNYFCYLFKKNTGKSIWMYLTEIRMEKAKEMLSGTDLKGYEIAYQIGYDNPSYFSKTFKKLYGVTPNNYRSKRQNPL